MRCRLIIAVMFFVSLSLFAQKKPLKISDFADWNRIENRLISPNGKFVAFEINKQKGDGLLIIYNVSQQKSDTIKYGYNACFFAQFRLYRFFD